MRRALTFASALVVAVWIGGPAGATDVSSEELRELARSAVDDPAALEELRDVTSVDGRRLPTKELLEGPAATVEARLRVLGRDAPAAIDAAAARGDAERVLAQQKFQPPSVPRPLQGILTWLGDTFVEPVGTWLANLFDGVSARIPGGRFATWLVLAALFALLVWVLARRWNRAQVSRVDRRAQTLLESSVDAAQLEREADLAEQRGDLETAMRLRFRAGLLKLDELDVIEFRPSMTSYEVARLLRSPEFDALAQTFDEVVYGERVPTPEDVQTSRAGWARVLGRSR
jgi:hypothetical protein